MYYFNQLYQLVSVHIKAIIREPGLIFWGVFFPILMAWGLGMAFSQKGELKHHIAVIELQKNTQIHSLLNEATSGNDDMGRYFDRKLNRPDIGAVQFRLRFVNQAQATQMLKRGQTSMLIISRASKLIYRFDEANAEAQLTYLQFSAALRPPAGGAQLKALTRIGSRYVDFLVPGLIALGIMMSVMWGVSYGMIDNRNKKLLRRMVATPMNKTIFMSSLFISRLIMSMVETVILIAFTSYFFEIRIEGSIIGALLVFVAGLFCFFGIAILTSSRTENTQIGNGLVNAVVMPMMICSGIFFSYHNFPDAISGIIAWLPLTMLADSIRAIFIEGQTLMGSLAPAGIMITLGLVCGALGLRIYKWH